MTTSRIFPPFRGAADGSAFIDQPGDTCPPGNIENVVPYPSTEKGRFRLGVRHGWKKLFDTQIGGGLPVQALAVISRSSSITGYSPGESESMDDWESRTSGVLSGQFFLLDSVPEMVRDRDFGVGAYGCSAVAVSPSGPWAAGVVNYGDLTRLIVVNRTTGALVYQEDIVNGGSCNTLVYSRKYLFLCFGPYPSAPFGTTGGVLMYVVDQASGIPSFPTLYNPNNWMGEAIQAAVWTDPADSSANNEHLFVGFDGNPQPTGPGGVSGTLTDWSLDVGPPCKSVRSGVMKFLIGNEGAYFQQIVQEPFGEQLDPTDEFYEAEHNYWRVSELGGDAPQGAFITGLAVDQTTGAVYITHCNQGIGPEIAQFPPDAGQHACYTLTKINRDGTLAWRTDSDSIREVGYGGFINDIPIAAGDDPSVQAVAVAPDGSVFIAGRKTPGGFSAFCYAPNSALIWAVNLTDPYVYGAARTIRQAGICIDPGDSNPVFAGDRNIVWDGVVSAAPAMLWKRDADSGASVWAYDVGSAVSGLAVAVAADGVMVLGTDKI